MIGGDCCCCCCCCCCCSVAVVSFRYSFLFLTHSSPSSLPPPPVSLLCVINSHTSLFNSLSRYVFQVKNQPYMSTAQRKEVILDHQEKAKNGHPIHVALRARLQEAVRAQGGGARPKGTKSHSFGSGGGENAHEEEEKRRRMNIAKKKKREYFWDYNTVEQVLLSCGIFVCLAGIMFESDRFSEEGTTDEPGKAAFEWQRNLIVYAVMIVVIFSFVFYFSVFLSEAVGITPRWVKKCFAKKHKTHLDALIEMGTKTTEDDDISMDMNPMQRMRMEEAAVKEAELASEGKLVEMEERQRLESESYETRLKLAQKKASAGRAGARSRGAKKKKKRVSKEMGQVVSRDSAVDEAENELGLNPSAMSMNPMKLNAAVSMNPMKSPDAESKKKKKRRASYAKANDPATGKDYFHDVETGATAWNLPDNADLVGGDEFQ